MATKAHLTVEDFVRLPESFGGRDVRYELVEGELVTVSPGMLPHNLVRDKFAIVLRPFAEAQRLGTVVTEQAFQLSERTVRVPDVAFVRAGRQLATDRPIEGAPDLAVEVVSPTNTPREIGSAHQRLLRRRMPAGVGGLPRGSRGLHSRARGSDAPTC